MDLHSQKLIRDLEKARELMQNELSSLITQSINNALRIPTKGAELKVLIYKDMEVYTAYMYDDDGHISIFSEPDKKGDRDLIGTLSLVHDEVGFYLKDIFYALGRIA